MKKTVFLFLGILLATLAFGQKGQKKAVYDFEVIKFFNKTNYIIKESFRQVEINKVYTGGILAAKDYQKKADEFFKKDNNQEAINNSYIARRLAFRAYLANNGSNEVKNQWELNEHEKTLVTVMVTPKMLNEILEGYNPDKEREANVNDLQDIDPSEANDGQVDQNSKGKGQSNGQVDQNSKGKGQK